MLYNEQAERAFIGSLLIDKESIYKVMDKVSPDDFYISQCKSVFETVKSLFLQGKGIDVVSVLSEMQKTGSEKVSGVELSLIMTQTPTAVHIENYADTIKELSIKRRLLDAGRKIQDLASGNDDVSVMMSTASTVLGGVADSHIKKNFASIGELAEQCFDRFSYIQETGVVSEGVPTGYNLLDQKIGGLKQGDLVIIAARPSMGKTAFMLNLVTNVADKYKQSVACFSLEMSNQQLVDRMFYSLMGVGKNVFNPGASDREIRLVQDFVDRASKMRILIDDTANISVSQIEAKCKRMQMTGGLDVVFIDYLQLIQGNGKENRVQEVSDMTRQLKGMAKRLNVPVVVLSQLSRSVEARTDKKPHLSDLRDSGSIEQDADIVMMLYRESYYSGTQDDHNLDVIVSKNRNGEVGTAKLGFDRAKQKIYNL